MDRQALWAAFGLLSVLALLKPVSRDVAFIAAFLYQLYVPTWLGYHVRFESGVLRQELIRVAGLSVLTFGFYGLCYFGLQNYWAHQAGYQVLFKPTFPLALLSGFLINLVLIAFPEEVFYRGYLQSHSKGLLGILCLNLLFALGHFLGDYDPARLLPFFPGLLFSWLVYRSGSILGATLYHALCNTFSEWLGVGFYWSHS